jgi:cobalt-zinc-cadmium efflux system protein
MWGGAELRCSGVIASDCVAASVGRQSMSPSARRMGLNHCGLHSSGLGSTPSPDPLGHSIPADLHQGQRHSPGGRGQGARISVGYLAAMRRTTRLWLVLALNLVLIVALIVVGIGAHSLGVLAAGADYLADAAAIGVSLVAIRLSTLPPTAARPNGFPKVTTWAALVNAGWLLVLSVLVIVAAFQRLVAGTHEVHGLPVLVVGGVAAVAMLVGALILGGDEDDDDDGGNLNMRAVLLDTAADSVAAGAVAVVGAVILATKGNYWLDPAVALVVSGVIAYHALRLVRTVLVKLRADTATAT